MGYNYLGQKLGYTDMYVPIKPEYMKSEGEPDWELIQHGDFYGFDTEVILDNGVYKKTIVLPVGKKIIRYGIFKGRFTSDYGTPYELLSLPYKKESMEYHEYIVAGECKVECVVEYGYTAPGFSSLGGAIQYRHEKTIRESLAEKILKEDKAWLENLQKKN